MSKTNDYIENKAALTQPVKPAVPMATISAAPPETIWSILQSSYLTSKNAVAGAPMLFLDQSAAGIRDLTLRGFRSTFLSKEVDSSLISTVRDTVASGVKLLDLFRGAAGDEKLSAAMEHDIEKYFAGRSKPAEFGDYDIYMAAGWQPKGRIKINGKYVENPPEITNMLAVFVRGANGDVEILDPSQKMDSPKSMGKLFSALWDKPKNDVDKRWQETAGTFVKWQLAPLIPSLLTGGASLVAKAPGVASLTTNLATKAPGLASKASTAMDLVHHVSSSNTVRAVGAIGVISNAGDGYDLGKGLLSGVLTKMELDKLASGLTKVLTTSDVMSKQDLRDILNGALDEHSYKEGANIKQRRIASLKITDDPWDRFKTLIHGRVDGFEKPNTPWDKWVSKEKMYLGDVQEALMSNQTFRMKSLKIAEKALSGQRLDDRELFILQIKLNVDGDRSFPLFGEKQSGTIKFTAADHKETLEALKEDLSVQLKSYAANNPKEAKDNYGIESKKTSSFAHRLQDYLNEEVYTTPQLLKFVKADINELQKKADLEAERIKSQALANNMAFYVH